MQHVDFKIGQRFTTNNGKHTWCVTNVGTRTVVAIAVKEGWMNGPPYAVSELVFDKNDMPGCEPCS